MPEAHPTAPAAVGLDAVLVGSDHTQPFAALSARHPLLLLPVRLETRFDAATLKIRIYPDQVHLDEHRRALTADERSTGEAFWRRRLAAPSPAAGAAEDLALTQRLDPRRAAWVALQTRPEALADGTHRFPTRPTRDDRPPSVAAALPERWAVVGWVEGAQRFVQFGARIPDGLPFAVAPGDAAPTTDGDRLVVPTGGIGWTLDYDQAVAAGMAISVALSPPLRAAIVAHGLTLVVVGVRPGTPTGGAQSLAALLEAHHYTDGLAFVAQGTPTNNTDQVMAGWTDALEDPVTFLSDTVATESPGTLGPATNAGRLAVALGTDAADLLVRVPLAGDDEESSAAAMNRALWSATWGRYLDDLLTSVDDTHPRVHPAGHQRLREWFVRHVRGGAALPVLGIGSQPYGILPVRLDVAKTQLSSPWETLEWVLLDLRERWRESLGQVPRLDPVDPQGVGSDPEQDTLTILGSVPHPARFVVRRLTMQRAVHQFLWDLAWRAGDDPKMDAYSLGQWYRARQHTIRSIETQLDVLRELKDQVAKLLVPPKRKNGQAFVDFLLLLAEAHRARQEPLQEYAPLAVSGVYDPSGAATANDPKLFWSGFGNATEDRTFPASLWVEAADAPEGEQARTYLAELRAQVPGGRAGPGASSSPGGGGPITDAGPLPSPKPAPLRPVEHSKLTATFHARRPLLYQLVLAGLPYASDQAASVRDALRVLERTPTDRVALRLRETLGLASHRLDAWLDGFANERLAAMRAGSGAAGIHVGGFGWVEDLRPGPASESEGFVHAPSLAHAATAAVLRAGWRTHRSAASDATWALDLRSARVRLAGWLLDGVRQGQALGELLGIRFERLLHDHPARLDRFIDDCRGAVLRARGITREARAPVDGLALLDLYRSGGLTVEDGVGIAPDRPPTESRHRDLRDVLVQLADQLDAVGDASLADSVHHVLQGNLARASATLDAVATGAVPPPELQALATPRPTAGITHRIGVLLGDVGRFAGWPASPRAQLEPALEAFVARALPAADRVVAQVIAIGDDGQPVARTVRLAEVARAYGISALDLVFTAPAHEVGADTRWGKYVAAWVLAEPGLRGPVAIEDGAPDPEMVTLGELAELARALRALIADGRPLVPSDLVAPDADPAARVDVEDAERRAGAAVAGFRAAAAALAGAPTEPTSLLAIDRYGIEGAIQPGGPTVEQATAVAAAVAARVAALDTQRGAWAAEDKEGAPTAERRLARAGEQVAALFTRGFPLLPRLALADPAAAAAGLARSDALLERDPARATAWIDRVSKVRAGARQLQEVLMWTDLLVPGWLVRPVVGQWPVVDGDRWAAVARPRDPPPGRMCWLALDGGGGAALSAGRPVHGLVLDSWQEQIPAEEAVTGVALHFDTPTSRPPQAMLLVVPPDGRPWSFDLVVDSVAQTLEKAKLRAVDPDALLSHGHHVPAIFVPNGIRVPADPSDASDAE